MDHIHVACMDDQGYGILLQVEWKDVFPEGRIGKIIADYFHLSYEGVVDDDDTRGVIEYLTGKGYSEPFIFFENGAPNPLTPEDSPHTFGRV